MIAFYKDGVEIQADGRKQWISQSTQQGSFKNGKLHGFGTATWPTDENDHPSIVEAVSGRSSLTSAGYIARGLWEDGVFITSCNTQDTCSVLQASRQIKDEFAKKAKESCEGQRTACTAGCGNPTYWTGSTYAENQSWSNCTSRCYGIKCN